MKFSDKDKSSPELKNAIEKYNKKKTTLNKLLEKKDSPADSIKVTLTGLAEILVCIYCHSDEAWLNSNANFYKNERSLLRETWENMFKGFSLLGGIILPDPMETPKPVTDGSMYVSEPPPPGPIITTDTPTQSEKAGRVILGVLGAGLLISGIGSLAMAGFKLFGVNAAVEAAKRATNLVAKKAAEELAKKLLIESVVYSTVAVSTIGSSSKALTMMTKKDKEVKTTPESLIINPKLGLLSETVTPPPPLTHSVLDESKSDQIPNLPKTLQASIIDFDRSKLKKSSPQLAHNLLKDMLDRNRKYINGDDSPSSQREDRRWSYS